MATESGGEDSWTQVRGAKRPSAESPPSNTTTSPSQTHRSAKHTKHGSARHDRNHVFPDPMTTPLRPRARHSAPTARASSHVPSTSPAAGASQSFENHFLNNTTRFLTTQNWSSHAVEPDKASLFVKERFMRKKRGGCRVRAAATVSALEAASDGPAALSVVVLLSVTVLCRTAELVAYDGNLALVLEDPNVNHVLIAQANDNEAQMFADPNNRLLTKSEVEALLSEMENRFTAVISNLEARLQQQLDIKPNRTETVSPAELDAAVRTDDDIRTVVHAMVSNAPAANSLRAALDAKVDVANQYTDERARTLINTIVNDPDGDDSSLRTALDSLDARVTAAETNLNTDCGAACAAGTYESTPCDPASGSARVCDTCADNTFSYGGSVPGCTTCEACANEHFEVYPCTVSSDRVCAPCESCVPGSTFEMTDCTATTDRVCLACEACPAGTYIAQDCTLSTDRVCVECSTICPEGQWLASSCTGLTSGACQACSTCSEGYYQVNDCTATSDTLCLRCTDCGEDEVSTPCSATQNAVCMPAGWGFSSDLNNTLAQVDNANAYTMITGFATDTSQWHTSFLRAGTAFNGSTAVVADTGYYLVSFNVRFDGLSEEWVHCFMSFNGQISVERNGLTTVRGTNSNDEWSFTASGTVHLEAGDTFDVRFKTSTDANYAIHDDTGLSAYRIKPTEGIFAVLPTYATVSESGWYPINGWTTTATDSATNFLFGGALKNSAYVVKESGVFLLSATVRRNNAGVTRTSSPEYYTRLVIAVNNDATYNSPLHVIQGAPFPTDYLSSSVAGLAYLEAGDHVQPYGSAYATYNFQYTPQSHFSAVRLDTSYAFSAFQLDSQTIS
ncbi:uncharacterized protein MONBRDRAFT_13079, partial [Monosiga brevicollis MX1]